MHQKIGIYSTTQYFMAFDKDDRLESQEDCSTLLSSSSRFSVAALTTQFPVPRTNLDQFYSADAVSVAGAAKRDDSFRLTSQALCKFANTLEKICTPFLPYLPEGLNCLKRLHNIVLFNMTH